MHEPLWHIGVQQTVRLVVAPLPMHIHILTAHAFVLRPDLLHHAAGTLIFRHYIYFQTVQLRVPSRYSNAQSASMATASGVSPRPA